MMEKDDYIVFGSLILAIGGIFALIATGRGTRNTNTNNNNNTIMDNQDLPRGYRNNNPLNIRLNPHNDWEGKVYENTDGVFEQFVSMEYGYRAALKLIRNYINNYGLKTVSKIITKWAPNSENNTAGYIQRVCNTTGWLPGKEIDPYNMQDMCDLAYAMALVENGTMIQPDYTEIYKGWSML